MACLAERVPTGGEGDELKIRGDVWRIGLLDHLSVEQLLGLMAL
jgi:hypothetical protein